MSKFKVGDRVKVSTNGNEIFGTILNIIKGNYNKENGTIMLDEYQVHDDSGHYHFDCVKSQLTKVESLHDESDDLKSNENKETVWIRTITHGIRNIVVVGVRTEEVEQVVVDRKIKFIDTKQIETNAFIENRKIKKLALGYSICHPEDEFDEEKGREVAYYRAKKKPLGVVKTQSWTMLQDDQCEAIIENEAEYVANHCDRFMNKFNKK